jgi:hypothetical protein
LRRAAKCFGGKIILNLQGEIWRFVVLDTIQALLRLTCLSAVRQYRPHGRHTKDESKEIRPGSLTLDGKSHQIKGAAFTPQRLKQNLQHSRANTDSNNSHYKQHTRVKQNVLSFMQKALSPESKTKCTLLYAKGTQPSKTCSGGHITPNQTQNRCGLCRFAYEEYKQD